MFNTSYLNRLRREEMKRLMEFLPRGARLLEFGAGTGEQARFLADQGFDVVAIDLAESSYAADRVFPVQDYDGRHIPLEDGSVDVIFSSNVLEHVEDLPAILKEFRRVLQRDGIGLHVMPTPSWRFWTFASGLITAVQAVGLLAQDAVRPPHGTGRWHAIKRDLRTIAAGLVPVGHGTSPEGISELWTFSPSAWRRKFERHGFAVVKDRPFGLFYTGNMLIGDRLPLERREQLSRTLGSATHIYVTRKLNFTRGGDG